MQALDRLNFKQVFESTDMDKLDFKFLIFFIFNMKFLTTQMFGRKNLWYLFGGLSYIEICVNLGLNCRLQ